MQPSFRTLKYTKAAKPGKGNTKGTLQSSLAAELQHQTTARYKLIKNFSSPLAGVWKEDTVLYKGLSRSDKSWKMIQVTIKDF